MKRIVFKNKKLKDKVNVIGYMFFGKLSQNELKMTSELVSFSDNGQFDLKSAAVIDLKQELLMNEQTFNVTIHRLVKKKAVSKNGSILVLHPILIELNKENKFIVQFD